MNLPRPSKLRTLLILGRVSNLPTVWSNCLAGWWLAGGSKPWELLRVALSISLMYVGGMFLNDAFDAGFDRNHRPTRPIPSGAIQEREVWCWGFGLLMLGLAGLIGFGKVTAVLVLGLSACILLYNAIHKIFVLAPLVMGSCRLFVYLVAASVGIHGVTGETIWKGLALGTYVVGLSFLARKESARVRIQYWPAVLLAAPVIVAGLMDDGPNHGVGMICSAVLLIWVGLALGPTVGREHPNIGSVISRLLAGIALVDWLAVADFSHFATVVFLLCFLLALLMQRFIPAT